MKLRKVQIIGFKSFRRRTGIEIGDGITTVVGPNGCGKSNIVDAVRWAMGSQSAKDLRGRAMEDVIFAGSGSNKPAGYAEVTLTFDNDVEYSQLPLEYRDKPQLQVTRRLYRTGESDYEINQSRARLRDIQSVFAGTGVGSRDAYSIIEQGRIGFIVSARAEERRVIIEEAAGITRYKRQRQTAERRLEKTRENLLRVRDVLGEVRRQLGRLERDAQKAAKYRALSEELRGLELKIAVDRYEAARLKLGSCRLHHQGTERVATDTQVQLATSGAQVEGARTMLANLEEHASEKSEAAYKARARVDLLKNTVSHMESQLTELTERISALDQTASSEQRRQDEQKSALGEAEERVRAARDELSSIKDSVTAITGRAEQAREQFRGERTQTEKLRQELYDLERETNRSRARLESLGTEQERANARTADFSGDVLEATKKKQELELLVANKEKGALHAEVMLVEARERASNLGVSEKSLRTDHEDAKSRLRKLQSESTSVAAKADALASSIEKGESLAPILRAVQRAADSEELDGIIGPVASFFDMDALMAVRVATVLGDVFDGVLVESTESARQLVGWARRRQESIVVTVADQGVEGQIMDGCRTTRPIPTWMADRLRSFVPVADLVDFDPTASSGGGDGGDGRASNSASRFVDDHRTRVDELNVFRVRAKQATSERLVAQKNELQVLQNERHRLEVEVESLSDRVSGISDRLEAALRERIAAEESVDQAVRSSRELNGSLDELLANRRRARVALERAEQDLAKVTERQASMGEEMSALRDSIEKSQIERKSLTASLDEGTQRVAELNESREKAEAELSEIRIRDAQIRERARSAEETLQRMRRELRTAGERAEQAIRAKTDSKERKMRTEVELKERVEELGRAKRNLESADRIAYEAKERYEGASQLLREQEVKLAEARRDASDAEKRMSESGVALERARGELERALEAIVERFHVAIDDALAIVKKTVWDGDLQERVRSLRGQIERIGAVNPAAEEAFKEASERSEYLSSQKEDLEEAMADIESAIRKMDKTSRELFRETYEAVNAGFKEMFPRLFKGGKGRLELTDPNDLLSTGIEIVVQPPGKRVQNMSLLSGGEKALTAVALIFSIFQLKPTPFCILDEVDAPLDEANVGRFSDMVREISAKSQFLIITHNTRTMESSDTLYGVTMEVPGESKLVGVRLRGGEVRMGESGAELQMES